MLVLAAATLTTSAPTDTGADDAKTLTVVTTADALSALTQAAWQAAPTPVASITPTPVTKTHWLSRTLAQLEGDGIIGTLTSVQFVPGRGDSAAYALHRGVGRCCDRWCERSDFPNVTATVNCATPIPEATLLLLTSPSREGELGSVNARPLADTLYFPHSFTVAPDGATLYV